MESGDSPGLQNQWLGEPGRWVRFPYTSATRKHPRETNSPNSTGPNPSKSVSVYSINTG